MESDNDSIIGDESALLTTDEHEDINIKDEFGIDGDNLGNLELADNNGDDELGDLGDIDGLGSGGLGLDRGGLYAYNFPSTICLEFPR